MARMGHASTRAAMIYQHTARERDEHIADALSDQIKQGRDRASNGHTKRRKSWNTKEGQVRNTS